MTGRPPLPAVPEPPSSKPLPRTVPKDDSDPSELQSPTFTFRGLEADGEIFLNDEFIGRMPQRWWVSEKTIFDPKIPVLSWPPPETALLSITEERRDDGLPSSTELWISGTPANYVLYVRARFGSFIRQGALRLRIPGCRHVFYLPPQITRESEDFHKYNRTIWFERD